MSNAAGRFRAVLPIQHARRRTIVKLTQQDIERSSGRSSHRLAVLTTPIILVGTAVIFAACATGARVGVRTGPNGPQTVRVNGRAADASSGSVLEVLSRETTRLWVGTLAATAGEEPLLVLDDVQLLGLRSLADIPASDAQSIEVLRPNDAVTRYGPQAQYGAVVVVTRRRSAGKQP